MEAGLYVSLSGQLALQRRLDTIANNVANSSTPGFRAENVTFESVISRRQNVPVSYARIGEATFSSNSGPIVQTGNPFDLSIQGDGYFAVSSQSGMVYTRDGRMRLNATGGLETVGGQPILDSGGAPLQINPARGPVDVARNGTISQGGDKVGTVGVFQIPSDAKLVRHEGAAFTSDKPGQAVADFTSTGIAQGYIENSNVNSVLEMSRLISVSRAFEALSTSIDKSDQKMSDAIRTLGNGTGR